MALIMKQARELGMNEIVLLAVTDTANLCGRSEGDAMENSYWINHVAPEDPAMQLFFKHTKEME